MHFKYWRKHEREYSDKIITKEVIRNNACAEAMSFVEKIHCMEFF